MIVPMKLISVVCLAADREKIISGLRDLGVLHIELTKKPESYMLAFKTRCLQEADIAIEALESHKKHTPRIPAPHNFMPEELLAVTLNEVDHLQALQLRLENTLKDVANLTPWGDFNPTVIHQMAKHGVHIYLCQGTEAQMAEVPEEAMVAVCHKRGKQVWFAVISLDRIKLDTLPLATVPEMHNLPAAVKLMKETREKLEHVKQRLSGLAVQRHVLNALRQRFVEDVEYESCMEGMERSGELVWIQGYIPADTRDAFVTFSQKHGCAVQFADPGPDDSPPTALKNCWFVRMVKPLFDFCGIIPGYREWDVSAAVLIFFTIFVAMIVNDAGYGAFFLLCSLSAWAVFRKKRDLWPLFGFFTLESLFCVIWGMFMGSFFGMPPEAMSRIGLGWLVELGELSALPIPWMDQNPTVIEIIRELKNAPEEKIFGVLEKLRRLNIEYVCFMLAFAQLGFARLWKARLSLGMPLKFLSHIGWILILLGNFFVAVEFIIFPGSMPAWAMYLYVIGVPLMLAGVKWNDIGEVFHAPLELINGFVDTLSYIRLFAVGLAGACVASNFNSILSGMATGTLMIILVAVFLIAGHLLNIMLCMMGIMVHAIRLNALEFSSHMGLEWLGTEYHPFKRTFQDSQNTVFQPPINKE